MAVVKEKQTLGHVLALPLPAQGHVTPLLKFSRQIANLGIKVTFVTTSRIHSKIIGSNSYDQQDNNNVVLTSIPSALFPEDEDKNDPTKLPESFKKSMTDYLTDLVNQKMKSDEPIKCMIVDIAIGWVVEIGEKMRIETVGFIPASAGCFSIVPQIPNLIKQENLDASGIMKKTEIIKLSDDIIAWKRDELPWNVPQDLERQQNVFQMFVDAEKLGSKAKLMLCNTFYDLESAACDLNPKLLPIGPLLINSSKDHSKFCTSSNNSGSFLPQDDSCLSWLNNKPNASVIYVSFGSLAVFSQHQLDEMALGLELSGRPFLWVVRPDLANGSRAKYPDGFMERNIGKGIGKIVEWAPQEKVLSQPSIVCFLSHCGWNSTMEGLSNGVPFLCWPYFADQNQNQNYICDQWKIGLRICPDENGIRSRHEISSKIEMLIGDDNLRNNALKLKELGVKSVSEDGSSWKNLEKFIDHLKK